MVVQIQREIEAARSFFPALSFNGTNKRVLSHVSVIILEHSYWAVRSTKIWLTSQNRWDVPRIIDLIFPHELGGIV